MLLGTVEPTIYLGYGADDNQNICRGCVTVASRVRETVKDHVMELNTVHLLRSILGWL